MANASTKSAAGAPAVTADASGISRALVVGAGQMGSGIAQVFASAGLTVALSDIDGAMLERARAGIASSVARLQRKGRLTHEQASWCAERISYVERLDGFDAADLDLAIEAITEHQPTKIDLVRRLDSLLPPAAILASNTSSISITLLGSATQRPARVVGMHFMNPPPMLELVEVVSGLETSTHTVERIEALAREAGKTPVRSCDSPGFITNRVLMPMINEAFFCLQEGVASREGIDDAMRLGMRHPQGPLALADLIGLDTCLAIMTVLHDDLGDDKYRPCPLLRRYVDAGRLGRKSGAGIYEYGE